MVGISAAACEFRDVVLRYYLNIDVEKVIAHFTEQKPPARLQKNNRCLNALVLLIIYTAGIGSMLLGISNFNNCPIEEILPRGLAFMGMMIMIPRLLNCVYDYRSISEEDRCENINPYIVFFSMLFFLVELGIFIFVCWSVFNMNPATKSEDYGFKNYCDKFLYVTSYYGCILGILFKCCVALHIYMIVTRYIANSRKEY